MAEIPRVILLIETRGAFGRGLLRGIAKYARLHGPWAFYREPGGMERTPLQLKTWGPRGVIARDNTAFKIERVLAMNVPTIFAPHLKAPIAGVPNIIGDDAEIGQMAAEYLMNRGFRKFAFCGFNDMFWSEGRKEGFTKKIAEAGFEVHCYKQPKSRAMRLWKNEEAILCDWLRSLPKPIGLTACNDDRAHHVTEACKLIGLHVPEEVAVLGVDNDEFVCELSNPPISSISYNSERAGYDAAALLDKMMGGKKVTQQKILIPATHVITRRSTDISAIEDRTVAEALRFIREHAHKAIQVQDVAEAVALSRVTLYKRFREAIGRSPSKEIKRARIEHITRLLVETSMPVSNIASSLGYTGLAHIARYFQDEKGMSLTAYRKKYSNA